MSYLAMVAEGFAVITEHDDQRRVRPSGGLEVLQHLAESFVADAEGVEIAIEVCAVGAEIGLFAGDEPLEALICFWR